MTLPLSSFQQYIAPANEGRARIRFYSALHAPAQAAAGYLLSLANARMQFSYHQTRFWQDAHLANPYVV